ncbi:hypothetical protein GOODEAATRI_022820, partial [Goodea atripinnis]
ETGVQTPSLSPTRLQGFEASATSPTEGRGVRTNSDKQEYHFPLYSMRLKQLPQSNTSVTKTPHQDLDYKEETSSNMVRNGTSKQMQSVMTSAADLPLEPPKLALSESLTDNGEKVVSSWMVQNKHEHDINTLPNLDQIMAPGYHVPFITPQSSLILSEPNEVPSEDFYPTNTMDVDWGSGDYLETMSFNTDKDDYSLVTKVLSDPYDMEDDTEIYDTSFPSRVGISPSSMHPGHVSPSPSLMTAYLTNAPHQSIHPSSLSTQAPSLLNPTLTPGIDVPDASDIDWGDAFTIRPTDVLLPDMNSLEYYTTQLTKDSSVSENGAEDRDNINEDSINATRAPSSVDLTTDSKLMEAKSSSDLSGFGPHYESPTVEPTVNTPQLVNASVPFLDPSITPTYIFDPSSSVWGAPVPTSGWSTHALTVDVDTALAEVLQPSATPLLPEDLVSSSLSDVHWFVTESFDDSPTLITPAIAATSAFSPAPAEATGNNTAVTTELMSGDSFASEQTDNRTLVSTDSMSHNVTLVPPVMFVDQSVTEDGADNISTLTSVPTSSEVVTVSAATASPAATNTPHPATTGTSAAAETSTSVWLALPVCVPQLTDTRPEISCPHGYIFISLNIVLMLLKTFIGNVFKPYLSLSMTPLCAVLQFVPGHIDVRYCSFSESVEKGLIMAFAEVCRRSKESTNFTVHVRDYLGYLPYDFASKSLINCLLC